MLREIWLSAPSVYLTAIIWIALLVLVVCDMLQPDDEEGEKDVAAGTGIPTATTKEIIPTNSIAGQKGDVK